MHPFPTFPWESNFPPHPLPYNTGPFNMPIGNQGLFHGMQAAASSRPSGIQAAATSQSSGMQVPDASRPCGSNFLLAQSDPRTLGRRDRQQQSSVQKKKGRPTKQLKYCREILNKLLIKDCTWTFYDSSDFSRDIRKVIENPMDFASIEIKFFDGLYKTPEEFAADVRLIFRNCYKYRDPKHKHVAMARKLENIFETEYAKMPVAVTGTSPESDSDSEDSKEDSRQQFNAHLTHMPWSINTNNRTQPNGYFHNSVLEDFRPSFAFGPISDGNMVPPFPYATPIPLSVGIPPLDMFDENITSEDTLTLAENGKQKAEYLDKSNQTATENEDDPDLAMVRARVNEMEEEAEKIKQMRENIEKITLPGTHSALIPSQKLDSQASNLIHKDLDQLVAKIPGEPIGSKVSPKSGCGSGEESKEGEKELSAQQQVPQQGNPPQQAQQTSRPQDPISIHEVAEQVKKLTNILEGFGSLNLDAKMPSESVATRASSNSGSGSGEEREEQLGSHQPQQQAPQQAQVPTHPTGMPQATNRAPVDPWQDMFTRLWSHYPAVPPLQFPRFNPCSYPFSGAYPGFETVNPWKCVTGGSSTGKNFIDDLFQKLPPPPPAFSEFNPSFSALSNVRTSSLTRPCPGSQTVSSSQGVAGTVESQASNGFHDNLYQRPAYMPPPPTFPSNAYLSSAGSSSLTGPHLADATSCPEWQARQRLFPNRIRRVPLPQPPFSSSPFRTYSTSVELESQARKIFHKETVDKAMQKLLFEFGKLPDTIEKFCEEILKCEGIERKAEKPMKYFKVNALLCKMCFYRKMNMVFQPCGHLVACQECAQSCTECPMCFIRIDHKISAHVL